MPVSTILALGDSITVGGVGGDPADPAWRYQTTLESLCSSTAGVSCNVINAAVSGSRCSYWPNLLGGLLSQYHPDALVISCGSNDQLTDMLYGELATAWSTRVNIEIAHQYNASMPVVIGLPMYQDPLVASDKDIAKMPTIEDAIYVNTMYYVNAGWPVTFADQQIIPATGTYVVADGTHPTPRGYQYIGRVVYDALARLLGWAVVPTPLCDLYGHRRGYPRPAFVPCTYA